MALMPPQTRDRLIVGAAAALAVAVPLVLLWPGSSELHEQPAPTVTLLPPVALALTGAAEHAPLFTPARTADDPSTAQTAEGSPAPAPAAPPTLVGIALGQGAGVALVKPVSGDTVPTHVGDEVDGWRVIAIARDHVVITQGEQRMDLGLDFANRPKPGDAAGEVPSRGATLPAATPTSPRMPSR